MHNHYEVAEWFRDAKFGIFLHWGPYFVPCTLKDEFINPYPKFGTN
ncbi:MAG: alpha-L-fucosidase [Cyclobacteriaceae bacterium]|nr:alpha-L-fucosidase [Cyclobacteriaceae bacterium]